MKQILCTLRCTAIVLILVLATSAAKAAVRVASVSGNWNSTVTWGGSPVPVLGDDVTINNGITVTVNVTAQCNSITFASGSGTLNVNNNISLSVTGSITLQNSNTANTACTLGGSGTISCASILIGGNATTPTADRTTTMTTSTDTINVSGNITVKSVDNGNSQGNGTLNINTGTINLTGQMVVDAANDASGSTSTATVTMNGGGTENAFLYLLNANPFSTSGTGTITFDFNGTSATVDYAGDGQPVRAATYRNLVLSNGGTKTIPSGVTINNNFTMDGTCSATLTNTLSVGNNFTISGTSALTTAAAFSIGNQMTINNGAYVTIGGFNFSVTGISSISGVLIFDNTAGTKTFGDNVTINNTGLINCTADEDFTLGGNLAVNGSFVPGLGTYTWNSSGAFSGTATLESIVVSGGGIVTLTNNGNLTTNSLTGTDGFTNGATGVFKYGGTTVGISTVNFNTVGNIVYYNGTGAQTVRNTAYQTLILSGSGAKTLSGFNLADKLSLQGTATTAGTTPNYQTNGYLEYKGSAAQTTGNAEWPATFAKPVYIDNINGVTLNATKTLSGVLTLTNGVLHTSASAFLDIPNGAAPDMLGGSINSYVDGPVKKTGTQAYEFKIGRNGVYAPLAISAPDNALDAFMVEYKRESGTALGPIDASISANLDHVSNCEYWQLDEINDAGTPTSVSVGVGWTAQSGCGGTWPYVTDPTNITLAHFNISTHKWDSYGGTGSGNNTSGLVSRSNVSTFSPFTLGSLSVNLNPLPVKFSAIKAFEKGTAVQIDWTNETEENLLNYVVERSSNGVDFNTVIATVSPRSNASDRQSYTVFDASPLSVNFYRIKAVELIGGKTIYSKLVKVSKGGITAGLSLYPNPVKGNEVTIGFTAIKGQYTVRVINAAGQNVYSQTVSHPGGTISQTLSLPSTVKAGVYNLLISGDNYRETKMFVVQ